MAKSAQVYQCEYCTKTFSSIEDAEKHEAKCKSNPTLPSNIKKAAQQAAQDKINEEIENIRLNATSPLHLFQLISDFLLSKGIKITFSSYPANFNLEISNSHDAPKGYPTNWCGRSDNDGVPRYYPGWTGKFKGQIEVIDPSILGLKSNHRVAFNDLNSKFRNELGFNMWYLHSGSGSSGSSFDISGSKIWLYDFPKMHKEYLDNGGEFKIIQSEYFSLIENYYQAFVSERTEHIRCDKKMRHLQSLVLDLKDMASKMNTVVSDYQKELIHKYNKEHGKALTPPPTAFCDNHKLMQYYTDLSHNEHIETNNFDKLIERIEAINARAKVYITENAEKFI